MINKRRGGSSGSSSSTSSGGSASGAGGSAGPAPASGGGRVVDARYYDLLGVPTSTAQPELKAAYRKLALQLHPDVNPADDAGQRFAEVAAAYDVLSDPASRALYNAYGPEGMRGRDGERRQPRAEGQKQAAKGRRAEANSRGQKLCRRHHSHEVGQSATQRIHLL